MALLDALAARDWHASAAAAVCTEVLGLRRRRRRARAALRRRRGRPADPAHARRARPRVVRALRGRHVAAGPVGRADPRAHRRAADRAQLLLASTRARCPSELAWEVGRRLADALLDRHRAETGALPRDGRARRLGHGRDAHAGRRRGRDPRAARRAAAWHPESRRVTGSRSIPLAELGRPRIDVTVRISGFFRDAFPHLVRLLDDAVAAVAALDEPTRTTTSPRTPAPTPSGCRGARRRPGVAARDHAHLRLQARAPTAPGSCSCSTTRDWRDDDDLAAVYEAWGGYAYGRGLDGAPARDAMRDCFARIEVAVKNVDNARARHPRLRRLLPVPRRHDRHRARPRPAREPARRTRRLVRPVARRRALAGRGGAPRVPRAGRQPALDRVDDPPRLQGRVRAVGHRRLPVRLRRHRRRRRGLDVRAGRRDATCSTTTSRASCPRRTRGRRAAIAERLLEAADRGHVGQPARGRRWRGCASAYLALEGELEESQA